MSSSLLWKIRALISKWQPPRCSTKAKVSWFQSQRKSAHRSRESTWQPLSRVKRIDFIPWAWHATWRTSSPLMSHALIFGTLISQRTQCIVWWIMRDAIHLSMMRESHVQGLIRIQAAFFFTPHPQVKLISVISERGPISITTTPSS